jgi:hypothetical protein
MTEFRLTRRTPAGRLRYLADQVGRTNGLDQDDHTRLAAVRLQLEQMADDLDEADDHSYREKVNAPLRPETIQAIADRIKSGDFPVRKVKPREHGVAAPATQASEARSET